MINKIKKCKVVFLFVIALFGVGSGGVATATDYHNTAGIACMPANFAQGTAFFRYYEARIENLSFDTGYWVVCNVPRSQAGTQGNPNPTGMWFNIHFDVGYPPNSMGRCLFREYNWNNTDRIPSFFVEINFSNSGVGLPNVDDYFIQLPTRNTGSFRYWTFACFLPPRTGINSMDVRNDYDG